MQLHKLKYFIARPIFQALANRHWRKREYRVTLKFLLEYAGVELEYLNEDVKKVLNKKVVSLSKIGGGYIIKNSLCFTVLDYKEEDLLEPFRYGALALVTKQAIPGCPCIVVDNPMFLYAKMANYYRSQRSAVATAVVGSIGKTTTKMMLGSVYEQKFNTCHENGNFTNITHILQLCQHISKKYEQMICEISEANYGTIEAASIALRPQVAVITAIDLSHMEEYGDAEEIKRQVCSITSHMPEEGVVVVNRDEFASFDYLNGRNVITVSQKGDADFYSSNIVVDSKGIHFDIIEKNNAGIHHVRLNNVWGLHNVGIAMQAFAAAKYLGMDDKQIIAGLAEYQTQGIRQNVYWSNSGNLIYADCYNAVAKSVDSALKAGDSIPLRNGKKIAVIADVEEAGVASEMIHDQIVSSMCNSNFDIIIAYGPKLNKAVDCRKTGIKPQIIQCKNSQEVISALKKNIVKGDLVLFKASHSWHLDRIIKRMWPVSYCYRMIKEKLPFLVWRIGIEFK